MVKEFREYEKNILLKRKDNKRTRIKTEDNDRDCIKFLKIKIDREARNQNRVPQVRSALEETVSIELPVISSKFNYKMTRPCHQFNTALKFIK